MLKVRDVYFSRDKEILSGISFELKAGQILGLVGPSGAGKSTLLKIISGLLEAEKGTVFLGKERIYGPAYTLVPGHKEIQLVNQDFDLDVYHTVKENLAVKANYLPKKECAELVEELLELLDLKPLESHQAITLSGGEQQRLALGRALALEPKVILLDEPFAHMDAHLKSRISNYLVALKKIRKTAFILVTHDGQEVLNLADKIAFFNEGKIHRTDSPEAFYFQPANEFEGLFFGDLNVIKRNRKDFLFRPTEFSLDLESSADHLDVQFLRKSFSGPYYQNHFKINKKESIVLYHKESLEHVGKIAITKKV